MIDKKILHVFLSYSLLDEITMYVLDHLPPLNRIYLYFILNHFAIAIQLTYQLNEIAMIIYLNSYENLIS